MNNLGLVSLVVGKELEKFVQARPDLKVGDRIEGKIIAKQPDGKVLIDFGKFQANVELKVPVEEGELIHLLVVEKGKQLKLKLESPVLKTNEEGRTSIKLPDLQQEKSIEELFTKIDTLLQKNVKPDTPGKPDVALDNIRKELGQLREHLDASSRREPLPRELRQDVEKLLEKVEKMVETTLRRLPVTPEANEKLEAVAREIRYLREAVENTHHGETQPANTKNIETIVKDVEKVLNKLNNLEQSASPGKIPGSTTGSSDISGHIKEAEVETTRLTQLLNESKTREPLSAETKAQLEKWLQEWGRLIEKTPQSTQQPPATAETSETLNRAVFNLRSALETNHDFIALRDRIVKEIEQLKELADKYRDLSNKKEIDAELEKTIDKTSEKNIEKVIEKVIEKLSLAAEKISRSQSPDQLSEMKQLISEDIKPGLDELGHLLQQQSQTTSTGSPQEPIINEMNARVENLQREINITLEKSPVPSRTIDNRLRIAIRALEHINETNPPPIDSSIDNSPPSPPPPVPPHPETPRTTETDLSRLTQILETSSSSTPFPPLIQSRAEAFLQQAQNQFNHLPPPTTATDSTTLSLHLQELTLSVRNLHTAGNVNQDYFKLRDEIIKQTNQLNQLLENTDWQDSTLKKEIQATLERLNQSVDKIRDVKTPGQLQELQKVLSEEIKPALKELGEIIERNRPLSLPNTVSKESNQALREIANRSEYLLWEITRVAAKQPIDSPGLIKIVQSAIDTLEQLPQTPVNPPTPRPTPTQTQRETPPQEILQRQILQQEINEDIARLKELIRPLDSRQTLTPQTQKEIQTLVNKTELQLEPLFRSSNIQPETNIEPLYQSINQLRQALDTNHEFLETRQQIIKLTQLLNTFVKNTHPPVGKEFLQAVEQMTDATQKIEQIKSADHIAQLKELLTDTIKPRLTEIQQALNREIPSTSSNLSRSDTLEQLSRQVKQLLEKLDHTSNQSPSTPHHIETLMKNVDKALDIALNKTVEKTLPQPTQTHPAEPHTTNETTASTQPKFSEDIQQLYENIKAALRLLQSRLTIANDKLDMPPEIKNIFQDLQLNLRTADAAKQILDQISQLRSLIEDTRLPFEKITTQLLDALNEIFDQANQLKNQNRFPDIRTLMQERLIPHLKTIEGVFSDTLLMTRAENPQAASRVQNVIEQLRTSIENALTQTNPGAPTSELTELSRISQQLANLPPNKNTAIPPANLKTPDSIANLSRSIEDMLSRLPSQTNEPASDHNLFSHVKDLLSSLRNHIEPLDIGDSALKLMPKLKSLVEDSGLFFEKKLQDMVEKLTQASDRIRGIEKLEQLPQIRSIIENDLKPNLIQLKEFLNDQRLTSQLGKSQTLDTVREAVEQMLNNIVSQQDRAIEQQLQQQPVQMFSFQIPIKGEEFGELKVFYNRGRDKESPGEFKLSLLLDMDAIGEIRSDFFNIKKDLTITFYVRDERIKDFVDDHLDQLAQALEPEFENLGIQTIVSREKIAAFEAEEKETEIISEKEVNVKV